MTRAVRSRYLKDENVAISDHLRNHIHLTNCIHLKNHMHRHSPVLAERSLMKDLLVLQRSRSLRDPSTSPPSWHSPSVIDALSKKINEDGMIHRGRRSMEDVRPANARRLLGNYPLPGNAASSKVAAAEVIREIEGRTNFSDRSSVGRVKNAKKGKSEMVNRKISKSEASWEKPDQDNQTKFGESEMPYLVEESCENITRDKMSYDQKAYTKTLSEQLKEFPGDSVDIQASHVNQDRRQVTENRCREDQGCVRSYCRGLNRVKKHKVKRRARGSVISRDFGPQNELSVASNSLAQGSKQPNHYKGEEIDHVEPDDQAVTQAPRNGCGIPWNWSRIHHRGKNFLDIAGRSLSCGLSESRLRKAESHMPQFEKDVGDKNLGSSCSSSSRKSDSDALPLLIEPFGFQKNSKDSVWGPHDYSGELEIFANNNNLKSDQDSDLASEARSGCQHNTQDVCDRNHPSLTHKYMPKTFKHLVGQSLVVQALMNAVARRKVNLLYVFYGPHGTGKTSCARIFARSLSCLSRDLPKPCGSCSSCISHDLGKSLNVQELGGAGNFDVETIIDLLENMISSHLPSQHRVLIIDDCDTLSLDSWNAILKAIDLAPRRIVFILVSSTLDSLPHVIIARCQKFFFPKLKDADVIYTLQWIAAKEGLEIDKDALKLIASRSDGSLRDAEMTLDQLSLLGQRISITLVQELVGLISDEKLVELLDLALSADAMNTVKTLRREIMETGVEPLALMSQLATVITDILAGSFVFTTGKRRKFFRRPKLSKEDTEKLRRALKTLSEAEKQLRTSNDKLTWLTAALLQLAPDQQYMQPSSSADTSLGHSPMVADSNFRADSEKQISILPEMANKGKGVSPVINAEKHQAAGTSNLLTSNGNYLLGRKYVGMTPSRSRDSNRVSTSHSEIGKKKANEVWCAVLESIPSNSLKQFMEQEGRLVSMSFGPAPTVQLVFSSHLSKSKAEQFRGYILQAFESVLGSPVIIEIRCESGKDLRNGAFHRISAEDSLYNDKLYNPRSDNRMINPLQGSSAKVTESTQARHLPAAIQEKSKNEIVEIDDQVGELGGVPVTQKGEVNGWEENVSQHKVESFANSRRMNEQSHSQSLVKSKVSLAHVIQRVEGCTEKSRWSKRKAISIAEKLEQENLRLESKSRILLCWKASSVRRTKLPRFKTRRTRSLVKLVSCSRCLCVKSPK